MSRNEDPGEEIRDPPEVRYLRSLRLDSITWCGIKNFRI